MMNAAYDPAAWQDFYVMVGTANAAIVLTPQPSQLMGVEILALNLAFLAINSRQRVPAPISAQALLTITIRVVYLYAAASLVLGIGGGLYVLAAILLVTLVRSVGNRWTLLTGLELPSTP